MNRQDEIQRSLERIEAATTDKRLHGVPCLGCPNSAGCADLELACSDFGSWVSGTPHSGNKALRQPSRAFFLHIMLRSTEAA